MIDGALRLRLVLIPGGATKWTQQAVDAGL